MTIYQSTKPPSNEILAYLAGFIDGDGTITLFRREGGRFRVALVVYNCDAKIVELLDQTFGSGKRRDKLTGVGKNKKYWRKCVEWKIHDAQASEAIKRIYPFLRLKKQHADIILKFLEIRASASPGMRRHNPSLGLKLKNNLSKCKEEISFLNKRGIKTDIQFRINMDALSWPYIAGFIDAEGYIGIVKDKRMVSKPKISITNTNKYIIEIIQKQTGGSIYNRERENENWNSTYELTLSYNKALTLIKNINHFLFIKRNQAKLILNWYDNLLDSSSIKLRQKLYKKSLILNKRGK